MIKYNQPDISIPDLIRTQFGYNKSFKLVAAKLRTTKSLL
jgi:hypothetical protein